ncbi:hypothetical protein CJ030_MR0G003840 [Morella rubra]|uniref:Reverse transcriptase zinc-binding domain-containing protein n=1 Tax=Morella rubra TaxID=262757 RepID=A0A6A1UM75_9ROSI|nr:hypothetical protein CJ030_MR0G003840 [Morella rubra]
MFSIGLNVYEVLVGIQDDKRHNWTPMAWSSICCPKSKGGLSLKLMWSVNRARILKLGWLIHSGSDKPWIHALWAKYMHYQIQWDNAPAVSSSWLWKGIVKMGAFLKQGCCFIVSSGSNVRVWKDPWIPQLAHFTPFPLSGISLGTEDMRVAELIHPQTRGWDEGVVRQLFIPEEADLILNVHIPTSPSVDRLVCLPDSKGQFTTKSTYYLHERHNDPQNSAIPMGLWKKLWRLDLQDRLKLFIWKVAWNRFPYKSNINRFLNLGN